MRRNGYGTGLLQELTALGTPQSSKELENPKEDRRTSSNEPQNEKG